MDERWLTALACTQVAVLYLLTGPAYVRYARDACLARNPDWVRQQPGLAPMVAAAGHAATLLRLLGAGWLVGFAVLALRGRDADVRLLFVAPMLLWAGVEMAYAAWIRRALLVRIPLPARRSAPLAPRTLERFAHPLAIYAPALLLALIAGLHLQAWMGGAQDGAALAGHLAVIAFGASAWAATQWWCLRRARHAGIDDDTLRRLEAGEIIACLWLFDLFLLVRLTQEVWGLHALGASALYALASLALQALALFALWRLRRVRPIALS